MDRGKLAHYRIISKLGAGGMGEVYRARDEQLDRDVAVKVLPASSFHDPTARARLVREAKAAAALNHPNVCTVYEVGEADGQAYIAMEMIEGQTLSAMLVPGGLRVEQIIDIGRQLADALAHAHSRGVVHRDLKSNNVIVTPDGRVKVLDFGLAKRSVEVDVNAAVTELHVSMTQPGMVLGTLPYLSPEQLRGESAQMAGDIWALGVVLFEMASGMRPFNGQTGFELSAAILNGAPGPIPEHIPPVLRSVIDACLAKEPGQRAHATDVLNALQGPPTGPISALSFPRAQPGVITPEVPRAVRRVSRRRAIWLTTASAAATALVAAGWRFWTGGSAVRSLAVLPLANPAGDPDLEYLCDGISESLIQQVSRLRGFRVHPLGVVVGFKGSLGDPLSAGRRLGVETVLAGALERQAVRLRIVARLLDVATGRQLWTSTYDRDAAGLLDVQDEIASAIMDDGLRIQLTSEEREQLVRHPTTDPEAYDLYLQARYVQRLATEEDYLYSLDLLERAVVRDPKFARAYISLSGTHGMMVVDGLARPTDAWPLVRKYMRQGVALDPTIPDAYVMEHSAAFFFDWDWAGAETARRHVLAAPVGDFDPGSLRALAVELWAIGRLDDALQLARRTRELDPRSPYLAVLEADYLLRGDQFEAAVALYEYAIGADPNNANAYFGLAETRWRQGRFDEAIKVRRQAHAVAGDDRLDSVFASASGEAGYRRIEEGWVRLQLDTLREREKTKYVSPLDFARAYAQLGDREPAFKYLEMAFLDRSPGLVFLKVDRAWDRIRNDPRFAAAVKQVGLP